MSAVSIESFLGKWNIDEEKTASKMKLVLKALNVFSSNNQLVVETISNGNRGHEVSTKKYDLSGGTTTEKIESELENSVFSYNLELQKDGRLKLNSSRLMTGVDGESEKLNVQTDAVWNLADEQETLEVDQFLGMSDEKIEDEEPKKFTLYFKRDVSE